MGWLAAPVVAAIAADAMTEVPSADGCDDEAGTSTSAVLPPTFLPDFFLPLPLLLPLDFPGACAAAAVEAAVWVAAGAGLVGAADAEAVAATPSFPGFFSGHTLAKWVLFPQM